MNKRFGTRDTHQGMKTILSKVAGKFAIQFAYLFGSHAAGRAHSQSDVDIAFYPSEGLSRSRAYHLRIKLMEAVMDHLHENHVDVVNLREAPLPLRFRAIQPSCVFFSRNEINRVRFEVATRSEYFDRLPQIERSNALAFTQMAKVGLR
jgi:predicted nucleotidyltransferase